VAGLLAGPAPQAAFPDWVEQRRLHQGLRNEVTLVLIAP